MLIHTYTRAQAVEDRALIDVSKLAKEAGFKLPVAITAEVENVLHDIPHKYSYQDYTGRLWDLLSMGVMEIRKSRGKGDEIRYKIICHHARDEEYLHLRMSIHGGDNFEPVITIDRLH